MKLKELFKDQHAFIEAASPLYGERNVTLRYRVLELYWRPVGILVRFVLILHPDRGMKILLCTDRTLEPIEIIRLYGVRFKIEVSFKQAVHTHGTYSCHFWMRAIRSGIPPSEQVVAIALRHSLPQFLADAPGKHILAKFIRQHLDLDRAEGLRLAS